MQLITIGLIQLNEDGSIVIDANGHTVAITNVFGKQL